MDMGRGMFETRGILAEALHQQMAVGDTKALFDEDVLKDMRMTPEEMEKFLLDWDAELKAMREDYERSVRDVGLILARKMIGERLAKKQEL
jgi:hypothetical protein